MRSVGPSQDPTMATDGSPTTPWLSGSAAAVVISVSVAGGSLSVSGVGVEVVCGEEADVAEEEGDDDDGSVEEDRGSTARAMSTTSEHS